MMVNAMMNITHINIGFNGIVMMELLQSSCGHIHGVVLWYHVQDEVLVVELSLLGSSAC